MCKQNFTELKSFQNGVEEDSNLPYNIYIGRLEYGVSGHLDIKGTLKVLLTDDEKGRTIDSIHSISDQKSVKNLSLKCIPDETREVKFRSLIINLKVEEVWF